MLGCILIASFNIFQFNSLYNLIYQDDNFTEENTLIDQIWIMDTKKKIKDVITELGKENSLIIKDFIRYKVGE